MFSFIIYYGAAKPMQVQGVHCVRLLQFAERTRCWHSFAQDRTTRRAIATLKRLDYLEVRGDQFKFKYPDVV